MKLAEFIRESAGWQDGVQVGIEGCKTEADFKSALEGDPEVRFDQFVDDYACLVEMTNRLWQELETDGYLNYTLRSGKTLEAEMP